MNSEAASHLLVRYAEVLIMLTPAPFELCVQMSKVRKVIPCGLITKLIHDSMGLLFVDQCRHVRIVHDSSLLFVRFEEACAKGTSRRTEGEMGGAGVQGALVFDLHRRRRG